jgi:hypothetical protein
MGEAVRIKPIIKLQKGYYSYAKICREYVSLPLYLKYYLSQIMGEVVRIKPIIKLQKGYYSYAKICREYVSLPPI